jgi:hypothetical protein
MYDWLYYNYHKFGIDSVIETEIIDSNDDNYY